LKSSNNSNLEEERRQFLRQFPAATPEVTPEVRDSGKSNLERERSEFLSQARRGDNLAEQRREFLSQAKGEPGEPSFFDKPLFHTQYVEPGEIEEIAKRHNVPQSFISDAVNIYGGWRRPEDAWDRAQQLGLVTVGKAGEILFNIPQWLMKKQHSLVRGPKFEKAMDDVRDLVQRKQSLLETGTSMLIPVAGAGRMAAKGISKVLEPVAIGSLAGIAESPEGRELEGALFGATLGVAFPITGAAARGVRNRLGREANITIRRNVQANSHRIADGGEKILSGRRPAEDALEAAIFRGDIDTEELPKLLPRGMRRKATASLEAQGDGEFTKDQLGKLVAEVEYRKFAAYVTGGRDRKKILKDTVAARKAVQEVTDREGEEFLRRKYQRWRRANAEIEYINKSNIQEFRHSDVRNLWNWVLDGQYAFADISRRHGIDLDVTANDLSKDYNQMTVAVEGFRDSNLKLIEEFRKLGIDGDDLYRYLDTGDIPKGISEEARGHFQSWRAQFDSLLSAARNAKLIIRHRPNYVPHHTLPPTDYILTMESKLGELQSKLGFNIDNVSSGQFKFLMDGSREFREFAHGIEIATGRAVKSPKSLRNNYFKMFGYFTGVHNKLNTSASAAFRRKGDIPLFLRDRNLPRLLERWTYSTLRHAHLRNTVDKISSYIPVLDAAGDKAAAQYVKAYLNNINGVQNTKFRNALSHARMGWEAYFGRLARDAEAGGKLETFYSAMREMPYIAHAALNMMYPNFLGLNFRASLRNLTQNFVLTAPEIGQGYGYEVVVKGALRAAHNRRRGTNYTKLLQRRGHLPSAFRGEGAEYIREGLAQSKLYEMSAKAVRSYSNKMMYFYAITDTINRAITYETSQVVAQDLLRRRLGARKFIEKLPEGYRRRVAAAGDNETLVGEAIADFLLPRTQFNYNRTAMSQFGREMGPLFSVFSKWPTSIAGDVTDKVRQGRGMEVAIKYGAPLLLAGMADYLLEAGDATNDYTDKIIGKTGFRGWMPAGSFEAILMGDLAKPPALDTLFQVLDAAITANPEKMYSFISDSMNAYMPGAGFARFITDDMAVYVLGERPSGRNFLDRTWNGAALWLEGPKG